MGLLRRSLSAAKLPHAYIFSGPAGVGKATTALAVAQAINCETAPGEGCDSCRSCTKITEGTHPDIRVIAPSGAGNFITVEEIRNLITILAYSPHEARARLIVVTDADRLRQEAANAFLKTLEEPPPRTHFVLCSAAPAQLLPTIRSRCQVIRFAPLPISALVEILIDSGVEPDAARQAAALAEGSAQTARELADGGDLPNRRQHTDRIMAAVATRSWKSMFDAASALAQEKEEIAPALELLARGFRNAAVHQAGAGAFLIEPQMAGRSAASLARCAALVLEAQTALQSFANPQLSLERMILALSIT